MVDLGVLRAVWQEKLDRVELACTQLRALLSGVEGELNARSRQASLAYTLFYDPPQHYDVPFRISFADETKPTPPQVTFGGSVSWLDRDRFRITVDDLTGDVTDPETATDYLIQVAVERVKQQP